MEMLEIVEGDVAVAAAHNQPPQLRLYLRKTAPPPPPLPSAGCAGFAHLANATLPLPIWF
jgi:hypothetical protein